MTKTLHHRACHLCEAICGLTLETTQADDGSLAITSIKGDAQDSFSRGHICPKAVALQDIQNDPDRLHQPLLRVGSEWQPIAWEDAFVLVAERLSGIQARHGQNAVAVYQGNPSVHNYGLMTHSNYFLGQLKTRNRFLRRRWISCPITSPATSCTATACCCRSRTSITPTSC
jgi:anaerobic selenocysteine-containing dehydrogenase